MSMPAELAARMERGARKMYFPKDSIAHFKETATHGQAKAFCDLLDFEMEARAQSKLERLMRRAALPALKSTEDFDFSEVAFPEGYTKEELLSLDFIRHARDFVFYGKTGRGKTHLAISAGVDAVRRGHEVLYFSTATLARKLAAGTFPRISRCRPERPEARLSHHIGRVRIHTDRHRGGKVAFPGGVGASCALVR